MKPQVPIEVDEATGVWTTDGLPMLYVPRHFFVNNHTAIEDALGRDKYATLLYDAGYKSAYFWCASEAKTHGLNGLPVFEHYLKRLSQRGWGQFKFEAVDAKSGAAEIRLENSLFVLAHAAAGHASAAGHTPAAAHTSAAGHAPAAAHMPAAGRPLPGTRCYMFAGWFAGAMDWVLDTSGAGIKTYSGALQCGGQGQGHSHCLFRVRPQG
jgi:hypothetical protein